MPGSSVTCFRSRPITAARPAASISACRLVRSAARPGRARTATFATQSSRPRRVRSRRSGARLATARAPFARTRPSPKRSSASPTMPGCLSIASPARPKAAPISASRSASIAISIRSTATTRRRRIPTTSARAACAACSSRARPPGSRPRTRRALPTCSRVSPTSLLCAAR